MDIDQARASEALQAALEAYPRFAQYGPQLAYRSLFQGGAYFVQYASAPPLPDPDAWEFQNAVVKGYKRLAGVT